MTLLLKLSQLIDWLNERVGKGAFWLILIMAIISAGNASIRFVFDNSSNGMLEIQWYLFAAVFLLCSPYTLQKNEHVRIDVISSKFGPRGLAIIDIFGTLFSAVAGKIGLEVATIANGRNVVLYVWYDNEFGYSCQVVRLAQQMAGIQFPSFPA